MKKTTFALALAGLAVSACLQAQAAEPQAVQAETAATADNAVMVGIDARTGKLRPLTPTEARALAAKAATMPRRGGSSFAAGPRTDAQSRMTVRHHANGGVSVRVPLSAMNQISVSRDAQGRLQSSEGAPGETAPIAPIAKQEVSE
jgi:hypothetical protein